MHLHLDPASKTCKQLKTAGRWLAAAGTKVWQICRALGVSPEECAFVGDSDVDMMTAINAGCLPVGVSWGYRSEDVLKEAGAKVLVEKPCDLISVVEGP